MPRSNDANDLSVHVESEQSIEVKIAIARAQISSMNPAIERHQKRDGMLGDCKWRVLRHSNDVNLSKCMANIDVIVTCTPHRDGSHADIDEDIDRRGANVVVDERTNDIIARCQLRSIGRELAFDVLYFKSISFVFFIEIFAVIRLGIEYNDFHRYFSYVYKLLSDICDGQRFCNRRHLHDAYE